MADTYKAVEVSAPGTLPKGETNEPGRCHAFGQSRVLASADARRIDNHVEVMHDIGLATCSRVEGDALDRLDPEHSAVTAAPS